MTLNFGTVFQEGMKALYSPIKPYFCKHAAKAFEENSGGQERLGYEGNPAAGGRGEGC